MTGARVMKSTRDTARLFRYMLLFDIDRFELYDDNKSVINACVGYPDDGSDDYDKNEEIQNIQWTIQNFSNIDDALCVADVLRDNEYIYSDKITISENALHKECDVRYGWDLSRFEKALDTLLKIRVDMIDDGKKTDYFFVHF